MGASTANILELDAVSIRRSLLSEAALIASREGFEALTLNHLGVNCGMNRSDIFKHFGSIENLRLAVIESGIEEIEEAVFSPCGQLAPGLPRLYRTMCRWFDYLEAVSLDGSCYLLTAVPCQMATPGPARERLVRMTREWMDRLSSVCDEARELGHLRDDLATEELVTELYALLHGAHWSRHALGDQEAFALGRQAMERRFRSVATAGGIRASKARLVAHAEIVPVV